LRERGSRFENVDTNVERVTVSNSAGDYFFSISAFEVAVAQVVTINATLKVGNVSQSITVEAAGTQVENSASQLGTVIAKRQ
jgi:hypothetical protein